MEKQGRQKALLRARRWTEQEAREVLNALEESGESVASFARSEGLSTKRLYNWRTKLRKQAFVEVRPASARVQRIVMIEVVAGGRLVRVPPDFDATTLLRLLAVLEGDAC